MNPDEHISPIPKLQKGDMKRREMNEPSGRQIEATSGMEASFRTVLIHHRTNHTEIVGAGCLIDNHQILTCRQALEAALSPGEIIPGGEVLISLVDQPDKISTSAIIRVANESAPMRNLVLLSGSLALNPNQQSASFATPLRFDGKSFVTFGHTRSPDGAVRSGLITGYFIGDERKNGVVDMAISDNQGVLGGAPVWSDELDAFVGLVALTPKGPADGYCITSQALCEFFPELPVRFRIPKKDRPKIKDFDVDDPNVELFGTDSEKNGRRLTATVEKQDKHYVVRMKYEVDKGAPLAKGRFVTFITYPDMDPYEIFADIGDTRKVDEECYPLVPDFTIAAIGDGGDTRLTLNLEDLAKQTKGPGVAQEIKASSKSKVETPKARKLKQRQARQLADFFDKLQCKLTYAVDSAVSIAAEDAVEFADANGTAFLGVGNLFLGFVQVSFLDRDQEYASASLPVALADALEFGKTQLQAAKERYALIQNSPESKPHQTGITWQKTFTDVWATALELQRKCSPNPSKWVAARHLVAAMLQLNRQEGQAAHELKTVGFQARVVAKALLEHLKHHSKRDNVMEWSNFFKNLPEADQPAQDSSPGAAGEILERQSATKQPQGGSVYIHGPVGFNSEFCGIGRKKEVEDRLYVKESAERLGELIALRETRLPLAIGLFGNWGSGKSYFMNLMDQHMRSKADKAKADWDKRVAAARASNQPDPDNQGPWCQEIVSVYFNAWHYVDTNLWASLVSQIFESLFAHLKPKEDDLEKVQQLLEQASGATAHAAEELAIAESETTKAHDELEGAKLAREQEETFVQGLVQGLQALLPEKGRAEVQKKVATLFGVQKELETLNELEKFADDARTEAGRAKCFWNSFWGTRGWTWRLWWLVVVAGVGYFGPPLIKKWDVLKQGHDLVVWAFTGITAILPPAWIALAKVKRALKVVDTWTSKARQAQLDAQKTPAVKEAQKNAAAAVAREQEARRRLAEAEAKKKQLEEEARNLSPERRITRFIEQRALSSDYRGQLGLVSLARRDFEELSNLFANQEALDARLEKLIKDKGPDKKLEAENEVKIIKELSRSIDRIVLFVDDLDRCQPEKVVDVLQAVHLLLAFPLFSVVVGVDQRCLRQSLREQFKGLLTPDQQNGTNGKPTALENNGERPATELDYLEKIFHVPFHLPPMEKEGFENFIEKLTEPSQDTQTVFKQTESAVTSKPTRKVEVENETVFVTQKTEVTPGDSKTTFFKLAPPSSARRGEMPASEEPVITPPVISGGKQTPPPPKDARVIGSVPLRRWERDALKEYHALIKTPRGATRLLNTYRLVRAGVPEGDWKIFCGDERKSGEFRIAMLLLAASAGCPAVARDWFAALRPTEQNKSLEPQEPVGTPSPAWPVFKQLYAATRAGLNSKLTGDRLTIWLNRVERFTF